MLLLARKRIVHKAANKLKAFEDIIKKRYQEKGNLKYSLIYVPEGNEPNYLEVEDDTLNQDEDSEHLIDLYTKSILKLDDKRCVSLSQGKRIERKFLKNLPVVNFKC